MSASIVLRYTGKELRRTLRMWDATFFIIVLPAALFLMFGSRGDAVDSVAGFGNTSAFVMTSMSVYGAAMATTTLAGMTAVERDAGWGRQLALTSLSTGGYYVAKVLVSLAVAMLPILVNHAVGAAVGASFDEAWMWPASIALSLVVALPFALYGLAVAMLFRSEAAVSAASGMLVVFSFFGTLFMPLDGVMLDIARFTPLYGFVALSRWPLTEGVLTTGQTDELWMLLLNVAVWLVVFAVLVTMGVRRSRSRR